MHEEGCSPWRLSKAKNCFIRSLKRKAKSLQEQAFLAEGVRNVESLLVAGYEVELLVTTRAFYNTHPDLFRQVTCPVYYTSSEQMDALGTLCTGSTVLAVAKRLANKPLVVKPKAYALVLDDIRDPGNLGTILRTADWYGIQKIICSTTTVDHYNPKVIQASSGSFARVNAYYTDLVAYLKQASVPIIGALLDGKSLHDQQLPDHGLLVIGNEASGISPNLLPYLQYKVRIPQYGSVGSLNAALATAIICDYWRRPRS